ncbi:MAG: hypothetical protein HW400_75 [Candidatus Levybacteria bacterium]|nr:hypothetical protein [Candidatus Levybacteria bacterium]
MMKILIGTPIHQMKDYCMGRWLQNVAKLQEKTPADLLLMDNSPGLSYVERVRGYCRKYKIKNYKIEHLDFNQGMSVDKKRDRIEKAEEIIGQKALSGEYDCWFSWECDQIIPVNALDKLTKLMNASKTMIVTHNSWFRGRTNAYLADFGVALINKKCLKKFGPLLRFIASKDYSTMTMERKLGDEGWFKKRVLRNGGNYMDVFGVIGPICHLDR